MRFGAHCFPVVAKRRPVVGESPHVSASSRNALSKGEMTVRMGVDQTGDERPVIRRDHGDMRRGIHAGSADLRNRVTLDKGRLPSDSRPADRALGHLEPRPV